MQQKKNSVLMDIRKRWMLHLFVWLGILFLIAFSIVPMMGLQIAFREFELKKGFASIFTGKWVGMKYMNQFVTDRKFWTLIVNTFAISLLKLIICFPAAILFAVMLSEMRGRGFKRVVQTASYLPHFVSWVIVSGILQTFFSTYNGLFSELLKQIGLESIPILSNAKYYYGLAVFSEVWKETGWGAIIYLAAISGIDPSLYESAQIDGAGRMRRIWHITLAGIKDTVAIMLILTIGNMIGNANFEQALLLGNTANVAKSEILQTYIYKVGLSQGRYSYAAAAGLFQSMISLILVVTANEVSRRLGAGSIY